MNTFDCSTKVTIVAFLIVSLINTNMAASQHQQQQGYDMSWPLTLTFQEAKTNALLGEALLKRLYARIGFSDNIIRAEVDTLFENLKEVIEKRLRKCERKRRRAGSVRTYSHGHDPAFSHQVNASLANQYAPRRTRY